MPDLRLTGWLALAAAAALLHLLNDWHIGRPLFRRWPLMLYGVYVAMAAGYALMGTSLVLGGGTFSGGRHLLTVGALGLNIFLVMCIAGRTHSGQPLDEGFWVPLAAALIVGAALLRAGSHHVVAGLLWTAAFALCAWHLVPLWLRPRDDGRTGCEGFVEP